MEERKKEVESDTEKRGALSRRELLMGTAAFAMASSAGMASASSGGHHDHHHGAGHGHDHGGGHDALIRAAGDCETKALICDAHCQQLLATGDTSLADCSAAVRDVMAACEALGRLAAGGSKHLGKMAAVCADVLKDCKAQCDKHGAKHEQCKACSEACDVCLVECEKVAA